jgi:DNA-binding beta-propeller fold protein YncE
VSGEFDGLVTGLSNAAALAYDPTSGNVYAALPGENSVAVVNSRTGAIVDPAIPVGSAPAALVLDANQLFVANSGSSNVTVINTVDNTVSVANVSVGPDPVSLALDSYDQSVFVASARSEYVYEINATSPMNHVNSTKVYYAPVSGLSYSSLSGDLIATDPSSPYATILNGSTQGVVTSIEVGQGTLSATTSANETEWVLGNASGSDVVVLNSTDWAKPVRSISVGANATELVLDPQSGNVYCWASIGRFLESVNLSSDSAKQVSLTTSPEMLSFSALSLQSSVYASSPNGSLIYTENSARLTQSSPVLRLAAAPLSVVIDSANDRIYIGTSDGLDVYNASSDQFDATVTDLSGSCSQLVLDLSDNYLWLSNSVLGVVAVNLTTLAIGVSNGLFVSSSSSQGIAFDPSNQEVFLLDSPSIVTVLSSLTGDPVLEEINVGENVTSLAYDPADGQVYAAGDSVTLVNATTLAVDGGPVLLGGPHKVLGEVYEPSRNDIYIASAGLLPGKEGMVTVLDGSSVSASEASTAEIPVGEAPDAFGVVAPAGSSAPGSAMVWVANALSGTVSVISSPPQVTEFTASPSTIDLGYPTSIAVNYVGGAGTSTVTFYRLPPGCASSDETQLTCTPSSAGVFTLAVNVTDSFGFSANVTTTLTVEGSLSILLKSSLVTFPDIDVGVPLAVVSVVSGGVSPYSYQLSFGDGSTAIGPDATHTYSHAGAFLLSTEVRDATGATAASSVVVTVAPPPSVGLVVGPGNVTDVAFPLSLNTSVSGGTGWSQENWTFGDGTETVGRNNTSHAWDRPGEYTVEFAYTDALGVTANRSVVVTVHPSLAATFSTGNASSSSPAAPGTPVAFTSNISGGTPPYRESWSFGDGSFSSGLSVNHSYGSAGTYPVRVTLTDAVGGSVEANLSVTVVVSSSSGGGLSAVSGGFGSGLFLGLVLGGVAAAVVLFVVGLRNRGSPSPPVPVSPYVPP